MTVKKIDAAGSLVCKPRGAGAVMASRSEPPNSLDFFPTPPWAARALVADVLSVLGVHSNSHLLWEPAAGEGHMLEALRPFFAAAFGSDIFDYGRGYAVGSFARDGLDAAHCPFHPDWVITNPPFNRAADFVELALDRSTVGVAMLVRSAWAEGQERYNRLFKKSPPFCVAQFVERVPMKRGGWAPNGSTATSYSWFIWVHNTCSLVGTRFVWIPPGAKVRNSCPDDVCRFGEAVNFDSLRVLASI